MSKRAIWSLCFSVLVMGPGAALAQGAGEPSCWQPEPNCLKAKTRWIETRFATTLVNNCKGRVYVQICQERTDRTPDCGEFGIEKGGTQTYETVKVPTGSSNWIYVGSDVETQDFACTQRLEGWYEFADQFAGG